MPFLLCNNLDDFFVYLIRGYTLGQYRIILSADTASEVRQMLSEKRR